MIWSLAGARTDLELYFEKTVRSMSRYDKYRLGADLRNLSREVLRLIQRANSEEDRVATLKEVRSKVEELKVVLRLARESGAIQKAPSYEFAAGKVVMIDRQDVGRFLEVHGSQAEVLGRVVNLKVYRGWRGGACRWTRFPVGRLGWFLERAREGGIECIVLVGEDGEGGERVLPRRAVACGLRVEDRPRTWNGRTRRHDTTDTQTRAVPSPLAPSQDFRSQTGRPGQRLGCRRASVARPTRIQDKSSAALRHWSTWRIKVWPKCPIVWTRCRSWTVNKLTQLIAELARNPERWPSGVATSIST
jgi:hypothetical protein